MSAFGIEAGFDATNSHDVCLTEHVDDVLMVGITERMKEFVNYFKKEIDWNFEKKDPSLKQAQSSIT